MTDCTEFIRTVLRAPSDLYEFIRLYADEHYMSINSAILFMLNDFRKRQKEVKRE